MRSGASPFFSCFTVWRAERKFTSLERRGPQATIRQRPEFPETSVVRRGFIASNGESHGPGRRLHHSPSADNTLGASASKHFHKTGLSIVTLTSTLRPPPGILRPCWIKSAGFPAYGACGLLTSRPRDFVKPIIDVIDANPAPCNHVHLPVQSGSSDVLRGMQRLYTREQYLERIVWMKQAKRDIAITTDIIPGFPGETGKDCQATLALMDEVRYDALFAFKYSQRPNTPALKMEDHIPEEEKTRRIMIVLERQRAIQIRRHSELVGQVEEVMVAGRHQSLGQWIGHTSQNRTLNFSHPESEGLLGKYVDARVARAGPNSTGGQSSCAASDPAD